MFFYILNFLFLEVFPFSVPATSFVWLLTGVHWPTEDLPYSLIELMQISCPVFDTGKFSPKSDNHTCFNGILSLGVRNKNVFSSDLILWLSQAHLTFQDQPGVSTPGF